jgi:putative hemolysin
VDSLDIDPSGAPAILLSAITFGRLPFDIIISILVIGLLLFLSALMSASEMAFFSLNPSQLHEIRQHQDKKNKQVTRLLNMPKRLLATILITNNFVNVAVVIFSTYFTFTVFDIHNLPYWLVFAIQVVVVTILILMLGEIMPKVYATQHNLSFARKIAGTQLFLVRLFYPLSILLEKSTGVIDHRISKKGYDISMSELSDAIELTADDSTPDEERKILKSIVKFGDIEVNEIMKPRLNVTAVDIATNFTDLLKAIIDSGYSRVPAYDQSFDNVKGILYIKDLLPYLDRGEDFNWRPLLRDAFFIPENKRINDLLQEFKDKKIHLAIVVDEYGGTSGIVTLEDIIEEIVGEINDELDVAYEEFTYSRLDEHNYIFEGRTSLNDFCKILGIESTIFDKIKGDAESLAGLILELMKKMPEKNESVTFGNYMFTVKSVDQRRIKRILVTILQKPHPAPGNINR